MHRHFLELLPRELSKRAVLDGDDLGGAYAFVDERNFSEVGTWSERLAKRLLLLTAAIAFVVVVLAFTDDDLNLTLGN